MSRGAAFKRPTILGSPLTWGMVIIFLICAVGLRIYYEKSARKPELEFEFAKAALQIGVISLAGTLIDLLVSGYERRLESRRRREDLLKATLGRITASYNHAKRARRKMRALALHHKTGGTVVRIAGYEPCMGEVIDAQLELETISSEIETNKSLFPSKVAIVEDLTTMECYLSALVKEFEKKRSSADPDASELALSSFNSLPDFVAPADQMPQFKTTYAEAHKRLREAIRRDLLE